MTNMGLAMTDEDVNKLISEDNFGQKLKIEVD